MPTSTTKVCHYLFILLLQIYAKDSVFTLFVVVVPKPQVPLKNPSSPSNSDTPADLKSYTNTVNAAVASLVENPKNFEIEGVIVILKSERKNSQWSLQR